MGLDRVTSAMFCQQCGTWFRTDYKFCPKCGQNGTSTVKNTPNSSLKSVSGFKGFMSKKSKERQSNHKKSKMEEVTISIGLASITNGVLKAIREKSLPLRVSKDSTAKKILEEAYKKRVPYYQSFRTERPYKLYYPDGTEVISLPGSKEEFTLEKYKEDLGKPWGWITLLLCLLNLDNDITD